jgi:hypothetical protein
MAVRRSSPHRLVERQNELPALQLLADEPDRDVARAESSSRKANAAARMAK